MKKGFVWFLGILSFICFLSSGYFLIEHYKYPDKYPELLKGLTPFYSVLKDQGNHSFKERFKAVYSELHYVGIIFPKVTSDIEVNKLIENWRNFGFEAKDKLPRPDLHWKILYEKKVVGNGDCGQKDITRWNGNAFVCGEFQAKSGHKYEIHVFFGPKFEPFLKYSPKIEVVVSNPSVSWGVVWSKDLNIPISIVFAIPGIVFLIFALACYWRLSKMKFKEKSKTKQ